MNPDLIRIMETLYFYGFDVTVEASDKVIEDVCDPSPRIRLIGTFESFDDCGGVADAFKTMTQALADLGVSMRAIEQEEFKIV